MDNSVLRVSEVSKAYGSKKALENISLELPAGRIIGLLGPNGSGKTTLIKLIAGLLAPDSGVLEVNGLPIGPESKALVSYLPDCVYFNPNQRICELLDYFEDFYTDFDRPRAENMLRALNIPGTVRFKKLSKGNREKVQLTLVMSRRAKLYLLDEPIAGVDPAARDFILATIIQNYDPSATILISTHLIADVEKVLDDFIFLQGGQVLRQGSVEDARAEAEKSLDEIFREVFQCLASS